LNLLGRPAPEVITMSNVVELRPPAAPAASGEPEPFEAESVEAAVREVSARIAENNAERRRLFYRLDELRGLSPERRRRRPRTAAPSLSEPVTFSIEAPAALQVVRGGR
jgi:hypothetical protein